MDIIHGQVIRGREFDECRNKVAIRGSDVIA